MSTSHAPQNFAESDTDRGHRPVELGGNTIASTTRAWRVLETSHPPTYYLPRDAFFAEGVLRETLGSSWCEWKGVKGQARYYDLVTDKRVAPKAAWRRCGC